ncbi:hypothetical protein MTO96_023093 [Rhipicephalus appendiculatus]
MRVRHQEWSTSFSYVSFRSSPGAVQQQAKEQNVLRPSRRQGSPPAKVEGPLQLRHTGVRWPRLHGKLREHKVHSILFLNIPSYGGGTRPWGEPRDSV